MTVVVGGGRGDRWQAGCSRMWWDSGGGMQQDVAGQWWWEGNR